MFIPCIAALRVKTNTVHWVTSIYVYCYAAATCFYLVLPFHMYSLTVPYRYVRIITWGCRILCSSLTIEYRISASSHTFLIYFYCFICSHKPYLIPCFILTDVRSLHFNPCYTHKQLFLSITCCFAVSVHLLYFSRCFRL
jgi:hypothetical protein